MSQQSNPQHETTRETSLLDTIHIPADMRDFSDEELKQLADEVRCDLIETCAKTGGHLGSGLGVVELTTAIHAVFNTPEDRLIFDVGHQCYPHKILTNRRARMSSIRQEKGLSGFTKRTESTYDPFGAGHSSTSLSAGMGMAIARDLEAQDHDIICVIGDGAMSAGMAYEAMNNAGAMSSRLIVILNDNEMSIAPPVGALNKHLTKLVSSAPYINARDLAKQISEFLPAPLKAVAKKAEETARSAMGHGTLFEELGFYYVGPIDGHNMDHLLPVLRNIKDSARTGPVLIHAITKKGKGYRPAENAPDKMHGVAQFDVVTGTQNKPKSLIPSYTKVFSESLIQSATNDSKIIAITAAMPSGTGLDLFEKEFPERMFDVGIAEQHAVTFAAGLATEGYKPFCALYSTFLQRGYDQVIHDVAIQNLPVRFAIDRAGLVGADGATHAGSFDIAYLGCLPHFVLMAPSDEAELVHMTHTAALYDESPIAFRFPRGNGVGIDLPQTPQCLTIGKGRIVKEGTHSAILSYGTRLQEALKASEKTGSTVADARFAKPLDTDLIDQLVKDHEILITIEEGARGGFGTMVLEYLTQAGHLDTGQLKVRTMTLPDLFQDHNKPEKQYEEARLMARDIENIISEL